MKERGVSSLANAPDFSISTSTSYKQVLEYSDWYVAGTGDKCPPYRYNRYLETLNQLPVGDGRQVHVDMGCGAGLFSWAYLDWATAKGIKYKHIRLFGLDHNPASLRLAKQIRKRLSSAISDYPKLRYYRQSESLIRNLEKLHLGDSDYVITFGHVLEQAHGSEEIQQFSVVIRSVLDLVEPGCRCTLVVVDAFAGQRRKDLEQGWSRLRENLNKMGIRSSELNMPYSSLNPSGSRRLASLHLQS